MPAPIVLLLPCADSLSSAVISPLWCIQYSLRIHIYIFICTYIHMNIYINTCIYQYIYTYRTVYENAGLLLKPFWQAIDWVTSMGQLYLVLCAFVSCISLQSSRCMPLNKYMYEYIYMYVYIQKRYIYIYIYIYIQIHLCIYICI